MRFDVPVGGGRIAFLFGRRFEAAALNHRQAWVADVRRIYGGSAAEKERRAPGVVYRLAVPAPDTEPYRRFVLGHVG